MNNIHIRGLRDAGDLTKERVVLKIDKTTDLGNYAIFRARTDVSNQSVYPGALKAFWFPDFTAEAGDLVVIYTRRGTRGERKNADGSTSHFVYMGDTTAQWGDAGFTPVLVEISDWSTANKNQ